MQERSVTLLGNTRMLPDPFFVLASQNPIELEGTYPLPEAQLDRFLFKLTVSDVFGRRVGWDHFDASPWRAAGAHVAAVAGRVDAIVRRDGADVSAEGRVALYREAGGRHTSGQSRGDGRRVGVRHLRGESASGDCVGRGVAGLCPAGRPAERWV